jgi:general stress protein 26
VLNSNSASVKLMARPMAPVARKELGQILFITAKDTNKCEQVGKHKEVLLTFSKSDQWISVAGRGTLSDDRKLIDLIWSPMMDVWTKV